MKHCLKLNDFFSVQLFTNIIKFYIKMNFEELITYFVFLDIFTLNFEHAK